MNEEQELEMWARTMWEHAHILDDETLEWLADKYSQFFEIKDNTFSLKEFESTLTTLI